MVESLDNDFSKLRGKISLYGSIVRTPIYARWVQGMLPASVLDDTWMEAVLQPGQGPYFFVAEAVPIYLAEAEVKQAAARITTHLPLRYGRAYAIISRFMPRLKHA